MRSMASAAVMVAMATGSTACGGKGDPLLDEATRAHVAIQVKQVAQQLTVHYAMKRELPATLDALVADKRLKAEQLQDAWGHALAYAPEGRSAKVCSLGPDGAAQTADDICASTRD